MASNAKEEPVPRLQIYSTSANGGVSPFWREKYEKDAKKYWDVFYKRHQDKFFKDRHYLDKEWGHYFFGAGRKTILEVGCGAGNTIFPLVATYPDNFVYACDFSPRAVKLVKTHKDFRDSHVSAFVCDLTVDDLNDYISPSSVDIVTMIFVLSAVSPEKMPLVLQNVRKVLKPSGIVLFRDYATGDLAQERLTCKDQKISENFYVRGDGTRAFYFSNEFLTSMFKENGFEVEELGLCCKQVENRSRELVMNRRWVQAVFRTSNGITSNFSANTEAAIPVKEKILKDAVSNVEVDISDGVAAEMFGSTPSNDNEIIKLGDWSFEITRLSKEHQHTCKSTGLMIWESARLMASVLARNPPIVSGKRVLELGSGCAGICSMVAARYADLVIATDGDTKALDLLTQNVTSNLEPPFFDKLIVRKLEWGNKDHIKAIKEVNYRGFDIIIGTDVTYMAEAILPLFATAKELILSNDGICKDQEPGLILCHVIRRVDEPSILSTASQFGFKLVDKWPSGNPTAASQSIISSWFAEDGSDYIPCTALNILYFCME
ncbi:Methyltransferase type [Parasponia andersonii]|uniref:Methyltransferase type n=1 Tax=Parasponia andersonii TaxID=3476 RepID=A0A2P5DEI1_PARAD|nr:Methyltransferase type [Parasponia andersonii]